MLNLGLVPRAESRTISRLERRASDSQAFLADLHRQGKLTRLQATQIGRGRGHHLLLGQYLLQDRLGSGGMGRVFLARHRGLDKQVAIKMVRFDRRHCTVTKARFLREVRLIGRLNHENVVHAYDAGIAHGSFYLAMEYVPGLDLGRAIVLGGAMEAGRACEYVRQAALGLQHIHERGLIHRDVKPSNLALASGGRTVKVLDVGLARSSRSQRDSGLSHARRLIGSPDYAAPEQILDSRRVDPRADLYSLGCSLYHLLTGRVPYLGGTAVEKALKHLAGTPPIRVEDFRPDLPEGLGDVVRRLMAHRRKDRFRTASEVAATMARFAVPYTPSCSTNASADTVVHFNTASEAVTLASGE